MTTLLDDITADQKHVTLSAPLAAPPPVRFRIDDEMVEVQGFQAPLNYRLLDRAKVRLIRHVEGTAPASHSAGAALLGVADAFVAGDDQDAPDPFAPSPSAGSGFANPATSDLDMDGHAIHDAAPGVLSGDVATVGQLGGGGGGTVLAVAKNGLVKDWDLGDLAGVRALLIDPAAQDWQATHEYVEGHLDVRELVPA